MTKSVDEMGRMTELLEFGDVSWHVEVQGRSHMFASTSREVNKT